MGRRWLVLFVTLALVVAAAFALLRRSAPPKSEPAVNAAPADPAPRDLNLPGKIQAQHVVPVGASVTGAIDAFLVEVGQDVSEGQLLARIGSQSLESAHEEAARVAQNAQEKVNSIESRIIAARLEASRSRAEANRSRDQFERAEKAYLRQQMLNREGATPRLVYEKSEREFETARTEFTSFDELARQAENRVSDLIHELETARQLSGDRNAELETAAVQSAGAEIRSPVNGILVAREGEPGEIVGPEEAKDLFEIAVDLTNLAVVIQPGPAAIKRIRSGQDALIFIADFPGVTPASVQEIRGSDVVVAFISPSPVVRPGMTAQVRLKLE